MAAIVDIDNTLLSNGVRPMQKTIDLVNQLPDVYLITGRQEGERAKTEAALKAAGVNYKQLLMNSTGYKPEDQLMSKHLNASNLMKHVEVTTAIDDDPTARKMYSDLGIGNVVTP